MNSRYEIEAALRAYLGARGGAAEAGEAVAAMEAAGYANSSIRWVAGRIVEKRRNGNTFTWVLAGSAPERAADEPVPVAEAPARSELLAAARELDLEIYDEQNATDIELEVLIEAARDGALSRPPVTSARDRRALPY